MQKRVTKGIKVLMALMVLVIGVLSGLSSEGAIKVEASAEKWKNWDIRTKTDVTTEKMKAYLKSKGKESFGNKVVDYVYDSATKNGVDPMVLLGMIIVETGYGTSEKASKYNNYGGVRCMSGRKCYKNSTGSWTIFDSPSDSIRSQAELLAGKIYIGAGKTTIEKMLLTYAPPSDGNNLYGSGGYMDMIGRTIEGIGYSPKDSGKELWTTNGGKPNYNDYDGGSTEGESKATVSEAKVGDYKDWDAFIKPDIAENLRVMDRGYNKIPSEMGMAVEVLGAKVVKVCQYIGTMAIVILIVYMGLMIGYYVALVKGVTYNDKYYNKMSGSKHSVYSKEGIKDLLKRCVVLMLILCIYITNIYITIMAYIYKYLQILVENIF